MARAAEAASADFGHIITTIILMTIIYDYYAISCDIII